MPVSKKSKSAKTKVSKSKTTTKKVVKSATKKVVKSATKKIASKSAAKTMTKKTTIVAKKTIKSQRSFKVRLPGSETFEGRFTGLTPYQAANKALSSYYRANPKSKVSLITFTIKESTRGSKRNEYNYNGKREKLSTPVEYTIKGADGTPRTITKAFKNRLTKIKKAELAKLAQAQAQAQTQA
tara:strand:- start:233 stop:781 length:549 start_codon:yes stop_codon:yes gene_type:complete